MSFPEMQLLLQILGHFPPRILQVRPSAKEPAYGELVIPERQRGRKADLIAIPGLFRPEVCYFPPAQFLSWVGTFLQYAGDG